MDDFYRAGITDLDNVRPQLYERVLATFPALLDVTPDALSKQLMREAAAANPYGDYASPDACNTVAERWLTQLVALNAA